MVDHCFPPADVLFLNMTDTGLTPQEGWHVLHLFYKIDYGQWQLFTQPEQLRAKTDLSSLVQEIRATPSTQLLVLSMVSPKADLGFMLLTPDLHVLNQFEKKLSQALGPDVCTSVFSYLSMTERSEYTTSDEEFVESLRVEKGFEPGSPDSEAALGEFRARMTKYLKDRLYPNLPDWPVVCFYPMNKRRGEHKNWYALPFADRKRLMAGHAKIGRTWHGKILQLITGATGLDDGEWGVTLFSRDTFHVKGIVYEMRFDAVSADYGEFGEFYVGLQVPLDELFRRLLL